MPDRRKKLALLQMYLLLRENTDENHPMTWKKIHTLLAERYGLKVERKTILRHGVLLVDSDLGIEHKPRKGYYYSGRDFDDSEIRLLVDGVLASKYIEENQSRSLIDRLSSLASVDFKKHFSHIHSVQSWDKTENKSLFLNIEIIDEAIENGKKITFVFNEYGPDKELHGKRSHTVSPYLMLVHNQRYYLMGKSDQFPDMSYFRVNHITDVELTDEARDPIEEIPGYETGINFKDFSTAMPYMYSDKPVSVVFLGTEGVIDAVVEQFGKDIRISKKTDGLYEFAVRVSPRAMEYWAMQYCKSVEVISPEDLRLKIKNNLEEALGKYFSSENIKK
ncbi:MAG: WYL domain-containing protein [Clostridia bacterium]|nr:WYL domain-containing protein [Clostridia bacterium]